MEDKKIREAFRPPFKYDEYCYSVLNRDNHKVLDIRGWGFIQKLDNAEELHDGFGKLVVDLLNSTASAELEKLKAENERMRNCLNCKNYRSDTVYKCLYPNCLRGYYEGTVDSWQPKEES